MPGAEEEEEDDDQLSPRCPLYLQNPFLHLPIYVSKSISNDIFSMRKFFLEILSLDKHNLFKFCSQSTTLTSLLWHLSHWTLTSSLSLLKSPSTDCELPEDQDHNSFIFAA